jgi:hypothetical protein
MLARVTWAVFPVNLLKLYAYHTEESLGNKFVLYEMRTRFVVG